VIVLLSLLKPKQTLVFEVQRLTGRWWQRLAARRAGTVITATAALRDEVARMGAKRTLAVHSGVKLARFEAMPSRMEARRTLHWREDAFIVGCSGDEGAHTLIAALALTWAQAGGFQAALALIGFEDETALRHEWQKLGMAEEMLLHSRHVSPNKLPLYLSACDVCVLPLPRTEHNTFYASPPRLFEFMAARRALIASDLPAWEDVLTDGEHALLVTASDAGELAAALTRLYGDPLLRQILAENAYARVVERYTWEIRAQAILKRLLSKK
jgi:glycosyltransferase involved in cell wall biosynthesis